MIRKKASEKTLEKRLRVWVAKKGGVALKFSSHYHTGWPDRLLFMPWGKVYLVELKSEGKPPTVKQCRRIHQARAMKFTVFFIADEASFINATNQLQRDEEIAKQV